MTRLQNLNVYLTERLMAAAKEILEVVGYTISEYQKETARTMKENDELRRRLREIGLQANIVLLDSGHPVAPPVSIAGAHQRQLSPEDEWKPNLKKDTEPLLSGINQELPEQHNSRQEPEEVRLDQQASALACVKSPSDHDFFQPSLPFDVQIVDTVEEGSSPDILPEQIKFEPDGLDYHTQEQPIDPQSLTRVNNDSNTSESKSCAAVNWMESGGVMSEPTTQESSREVSIVSCPKCGRTFSQLKDLKTHLLIHEGEKQYICATCGESFKKQTQLKHHEGIHTGRAKNRCTVCGKCFAYLGKLKEHLRIHTGEKPFGCTVCGKRFSQSVHLKVHLRVHTGEKPYSCPFCGKRFVQSSQIKRHLAIHTR